MISSIAFSGIQVLQSTIYDVDLDRILQSIHVYLQELGMEEIRRRHVLNSIFFFFVSSVLNVVNFYLGLELINLFLFSDVSAFMILI